MKRRIIMGVFATVCVLVMSAGSCDRRGLGDAPVGKAHEAPREVIVMPDTFPNLVVVCDGPTRIYVTTREAPPVVVADHPLCHGEEPITEQGREVPLPEEGE